MDASAPIVIGFDGSATAAAALRRGLDLAARLQVPARVVRAWSVSNAPRPQSWEPGYVPPIDDFADAVRCHLREQVEPLAAEFPGVQVSLEVPHGPAGRELVAAAETAQMIVVGDRGRGGLPELLLGSVSKEVANHASCDVLVVRAR